MARRKNPEDQPDESNDLNAGSDDTFGLPEIEYEPINRETTSPPPADVPEPEPQQTHSHYTEEQPVTNSNMERDDVRQTEYNTTYYDEDEGGSPWPKILGIVFLLLLIGAGAWYFGWKRPKDTEARLERERREQAQLDSARRAQQAAEEERARIAAENQRRADSVAAAAAPVPGTIETLNERTGRYYVIVASAIDGDLLMDYAKKLSEKGVNPKIIPPYGTVKFHRLTVAEGETFTSAQQIADQLKGEYNDALWVLKY